LSIPEPNAAHSLNPDSLDWALAHARGFGDTIFLPDAFEYQAIHDQWSETRDWLAQQDIVKWQPRPWRRFLVNKSEVTFRYVTQLDPLEYLAFTALLLNVGPALEALRVPADDRVVFSWRFAADSGGQMYDPRFEWTGFVDRCLELALQPEVEWVVVADIADFFPRIYIHPVERALAAATSDPAAYCLLRMIRHWNAFVSYGLPVGIAGSRIIAEATIDDVDRTMIGRGDSYCRYADDIRVFCQTQADAHAALEDLARALFEGHGLTLQPMKTEIVSAVEYRRRFALTPDRVEAESLTTKFHDLLERAELAEKYHEDIEYDDLPEEVREEIDQLNLREVFEEQIDANPLDLIVIRILLHRLGQLNIQVLDEVLDNLPRLAPVMDSVIRYLRHLRDLDEADRRAIGARIIGACQADEASTYEQVCLLSLFTESAEFDNENTFEQLERSVRDPAVKREITLALGRAHKEHWLMQRRRDAGALDPWGRRAFYAAFSCVTPVPRNYYYRSLRGGADVLDKAVIDWASRNPF